VSDAPSALRVPWIGPKVFAAPRGAPRARRGTDVVLLVLALAGLGLAVAAYPPSAFERALQRLLAAVPGWLDPLWGFCVDLLWLSAIILLLLALARRRLALVLQAFGALALATALGLAGSRLAVGTWPDAVESLFGTADAPSFPYVRGAAATAVLLTISPHLVRPLRRLARWLVLLGVVGAAALGAATPVGAIGGVLAAVAGAAAMRLLTGTAIGRPTAEGVAAGLALLGIDVRELEPAERQLAGVFHLLGRDREGRRLLVKVYGRDAADTELLATLWRRAWYRGDVGAIGRGRLQAAQHEALATLLAANAGVPTRAVVTAASTVDDDALVVLRGEVEPLGALPPERLDDDLLLEAWSAVRRLGAARLAHQRLDADTIALVDGEVGLVDFAGAAITADPILLAVDRAQLLMTTVALVGQERALAVAERALGREELADLLPYLQSAALHVPLRRALKAADVDPDAFRADVASRAGVEAPEPLRIRRVTWRSAIQLALLVFATYTIISAASGVDWGQVWTSVEDASWGWLLAALVVAQLPRLAQACSTLGSVPAALPFGPVYAMELAAGYMNVALPSMMARMAVTIRFFQRQGVPPATAVSGGVIDSVAGTTVQVVLLGSLLLFTESSLALELSGPASGAGWLLGLVALAVVATVVVAVAVRPVRTAISERVRRWWPDVRAALRNLRASNKLGLLIGGNLGKEVLFAVALGVFARGFGYDISLTELLVINIAVSLVASFVPVPGGVGVAEVGLTLGLTAAGMTPEAAVATTLLYRIATFYLPPLWGFFALRWLQRNRLL
jgi:uncharacterized membrane protein YbhN (UPF0104 family)